MVKYPISEIQKTRKTPISAIPVLFFDPIAIRLLWLISNYTRLTPNHITIISLGIGFLSITFIINSDFHLAALFFSIYYLLDCVDGKLARLLNKKSSFGDVLEHFGGDLLLAILSFFYLISINPSNNWHIFLLIVTPLLISINNSLGFYFKHKISLLTSSSGSYNPVGKIAKFKTILESKGIHARLDNTDSIHFVYFIAPIFFYYNQYHYAYIFLSIGVLVMIMAILIRLKVNFSKID